MTKEPKPAAAPNDPRARIVDALMALAAQRGIAERNGKPIIGLNIAA